MSTTQKTEYGTIRDEILEVLADNRRKRWTLVELEERCLRDWGPALPGMFAIVLGHLMEDGAIRSFKKGDTVAMVQAAPSNSL